MRLAMSFGLCGALIFSACGSDGGGGAAATGGGPSGGAAGAAGAGGTAGDAAVGGTSGTGGSAGSDAGGDGPVGDGNVPKPEPGDIQYMALNPLPSGEQILFNDWTPFPNRVSSIKPDGSAEVGLFEAYRVWSMGVSNDLTKIAFACGDPQQEEHYGLTLGDAIQHTWLYDVASQAASVLSWGNVNDECHAWSPKDDFIYVCRRHDFKPDLSHKSYRLARLGAKDGAATWLGPEPPKTELELHPQPTDDDAALFYTRVTAQGGKQNRTIMKLTLPAGGAPEVVRDQAGSAALSPDGTRLLFADTSQKSALFSMKLDGSDVKKVASHAGTSTAWSPDGSKIAYLWGETMSCNHIYVVAADGSQADAPVKVRDCGSAFITELAWIDKK